jgi:hypothetical protein
MLACAGNSAALRAGEGDHSMRSKEGAGGDDGESKNESISRRAKSRASPSLIAKRMRRTHGLDEGASSGKQGRTRARVRRLRRVSEKEKSCWSSSSNAGRRRQDRNFCSQRAGSLERV